MSAFYDNRMGFFGMLLPGQYRCETVVNGRVFMSDIYTVEDDGKYSQRHSWNRSTCLWLDGGSGLTSLHGGHSMKSLSHGPDD